MCDMDFKSDLFGSRWLYPCQIISDSDSGHSDSMSEACLNRVCEPGVKLSKVLFLRP